MGGQSSLYHCMGRQWNDMAKKKPNGILRYIDLMIRKITLSRLNYFCFFPKSTRPKVFFCPILILKVFQNRLSFSFSFSHSLLKAHFSHMFRKNVYSSAKDPQVNKVQIKILKFT